MYKEIMNDNDYIFKNGITSEEKISNLKEIISLLSKKLEMDLQYIDIESIIINKDKESVKYFLILFINILKSNEKLKEKYINEHFNNDIDLLKRSCITDRDEKEDSKNKNNNNMNVSFDEMLLRNKNIDVNSKFEKFLENRAKNKNVELIYGKNLKENFYGKKTDLRIYFIPPLKHKENDEDLKNKLRLYNSVDKKGKKYYHIYLSQKEMIYEIVKIIKNIISPEDFFNFLINNTFSKNMMNIISKIYELHFVRHKNLFISKHYLKDHEIDIKPIVLKELNLYGKYNKDKNKNKDNNNNIKSKNNIEELSKLFKNIKWLRKYHDFNCLRSKHEIKETKINYEFNRKKNMKYINDFQKLFLKLISIENKYNKEDKELQNFLFNLKYYQIIETKADIIKNLRNNNKELKILKKHNLLI